MYSAGNLVILDIPIETNLRTRVVKQYLDTLMVKKGYNVAGDVFGLLARTTRFV